MEDALICGALGQGIGDRRGGDGRFISGQRSQMIVDSGESERRQHSCQVSSDRDTDRDTDLDTDSMWWTRKLANKWLQRRCLSAACEQNRLGIIGVPFAKGQTKQGVELAPDLLRQNRLRQVLQSSDGKLSRGRKKKNKFDRLIVYLPIDNCAYR